MDYAKKNGYLHPKYFVDDGISGTTFDRPGFREMEALIEAGKVSAVIVKDLSRFGREHVETSRYLEIIYPTLGVKFVAIQERVDTETGEGTEMMPFHNIFNEWYAAQTSKKVRAVWAMKAANGKRSNFRVPYGYKRDELDKEKWLVDDAAAEVVRRIYHLCLEGKGPEQIARLLQKEKVLTPTAYYYSVGSSSANRPMPSDPYLWKDSTIDAILSNRKYLRCNFINNLSLQFNGWTWNCNLNKVFSWKSPSSKVGCALPKCIEDTVRIVHLKYTQEVFWNLRAIRKSKDTIIRAGNPFVLGNIDPSCQQVHMIHGKVSHIYDLIVGI